MNPRDMVDFWMQAGEDRWFDKDASFDGALAIRFGQALKEAKAGGLDHWGETPEGALGLVLLLDQVSRNIHRGSSLAFAADHKALTLAKGWIGRGFHRTMRPDKARWFIMPFEHAEDLDAQDRGVALFGAMGMHEMVYWAGVHRDIIFRFGRFPHRNKVLGRTSTPEELAFLADGGFSG